MLTENLRSSIINKYFDAMLRTTVCDCTEYARIRNCNPVTVKSWKAQGLRRIAEAAGSIEGLNTENVLHSFENTVWNGGFREDRRKLCTGDLFRTTEIFPLPRNL